MEENEKPIEAEDSNDFEPDNTSIQKVEDKSQEQAKPKPQSRQTEQPVPAQTQPAITAPTQPEMPKHVLPPVKYKLKAVLLFSDFFAIGLYVYFLLITSIITDIRAETFSFVSNRMFAFYSVLIITIALGILVLIFKGTKSARTRFERDNEVRQNPNIKVWLTGYDWGWPILFVPTIVLMVFAGVTGLLISFIPGNTQAELVLQNLLGGIVITFGAVNAAVVIFKLKPMTLGFILGSFAIMLLIMLLHGPGTLISFFKGFRHLGVSIEPQGYLLLAYVWSIFLRVIWLKSLFYYWVFIPNRLELQHGLNESNDSVDRDDLRHQIDTDDVILRWWNVGIITYYFPQLDRLPITNVVWGIRKKAQYANRIASIKTMQN